MTTDFVNSNGRHDLSQNGSSLACSGPTHRSSQEFDLRGLVSPSNGAVEMVTVTR